MPVRHRHRVGRHLVADEESGIVAYDDAVRPRWDNVIVRQRQYESRQPQDFVRALNDPKVVRPIRDTWPTPATDNTLPGYIDGTGIENPSNGAAAHLFQSGIGQMIVGGSNLYTVLKVR